MIIWNRNISKTGTTKINLQQKKLQPRKRIVKITKYKVNAICRKIIITY